MKNWNGTIELRPHWSSHTHVCRCVADASQRLDFRPSFQKFSGYTPIHGIHRRRNRRQRPSQWTPIHGMSKMSASRAFWPRQAPSAKHRFLTFSILSPLWFLPHSNFITWCLSTSTPLYYYYYTGKRSREDAGDPWIHFQPGMPGINTKPYRMCSLTIECVLLL